MIFGRDVVVVEWSFEAEHKGPFAGRDATGASVEVPGCSVYEYDSVNRQITGGRIYFDVATLLKQIGRINLGCRRQVRDMVLRQGLPMEIGQALEPRRWVLCAPISPVRSILARAAGKS